MSESKPQRSLEAPANLGAPMPSPLSSHASRALERYPRTFGRESARMVILSLLCGIVALFVLIILGHIVHGVLY
jgi:hypothetical protein